MGIAPPLVEHPPQEPGLQSLPRKEVEKASWFFICVANYLIANAFGGEPIAPR